jgi:ComF family protein
LEFRRQTESWLDALLGFIYPNRCQLCREQRATAGDGYVCPGCRAAPGGVQFIAAPFCDRCGLPYQGEITTSFECGNCREMRLHFEFARAAVAASDLVLEVNHRYKYQRQLWFEPFLAGLLIGQAAPVLKAGNWDWIVPVPLHSTKQREREFNQAERLGRHLGRAAGIPINRRLLKRVSPTRTQTLLTRKQRAHNMVNAFAYRAPRPLNGDRIILVDDVLTTGATTSECAKVLRENGAGEVCVWTVARGLQSR